METKEFFLKLNDISIEGEFWGYASTFGNVDLGNDKVVEGAFKKTLKKSGGKIPILADHNTRNQIGWNLDAEEDQKGLKVHGLLDMNVQAAKEKWSLAKKAKDIGARMGLSIGYQANKTDWEGETRLLKEIDLYEYSILAFPMNELARITDIKGIVPYQDLPLADPDMPWDAAAAEKRIRNWAGANEEPNEKYRAAFLWYDSDNPKLFVSYKLQIGDIVNDKLVAVPKGIFAAAAAIQGARGGVDIPEGDRAKAKAHLAKYYKKMDRTPPWEGSSGFIISASPGITKSVREFEDFLRDAGFSRKRAKSIASAAFNGNQRDVDTGEVLEAIARAEKALKI